MKNVLKKLSDARVLIAGSELKKEGHNDYSNYDYFTPEQIGRLTHGAASEYKLFNKFDLVRNELGLHGVLTIHDLESGEQLEFTMATAIPEIKATNASQQVGGCMTYTERYLLQTAYSIKDNSLDPDTTHRTNETVKAKEEADEKKKWLNKWVDKDHNKESEHYWKVVNSAIDKGMTTNDLREHYKISKEIEKELNNDLG